MLPKGKPSDITISSELGMKKHFLKRYINLKKKNYKFWNCDLDLRFFVETKKKILFQIFCKLN